MKKNAKLPTKIAELNLAENFFFPRSRSARQ